MTKEQFDSIALGISSAEASRLLFNLPDKTLKALAALITVFNDPSLVDNDLDDWECHLHTYLG